MTLHSPRLDQGQQLLRYPHGLEDWLFKTWHPTPWRNAVPWSTMWRTGSWIHQFANFYFLDRIFMGTTALLVSSFLVFSAQFTLVSVYRFFLLTKYYFFRRLVCIVFKSILSIHTKSWSSIFFRWGLSIYFTFHDKPEEDSGHYIY